MKHVFECGIVGESNDEVGDTFLAGMMDVTLPSTQDRKLPDDFTLELPDIDFTGSSFSESRSLEARYKTLCDGMVERGYEWFLWRDEDRFCRMLRFRSVT